MPPRFKRACTKCGGLFQTGGSLCSGCEKRKQSAKEQNETRRAKKRHLYGGDYTARAKQIRDTATHCYLCGGVFQPGDKVEADHLFPELGNKSPLGGAHPECNRNKSNNNYNVNAPPL